MWRSKFLGAAVVGWWTDSRITRAAHPPHEEPQPAVVALVNEAMEFADEPATTIHDLGSEATVLDF